MPSKMQAFNLSAPDSPQTPDSFDAIYITEQTPLNKDKALLSPVGGFGISQQQLLQINEVVQVAETVSISSISCRLGPYQGD